MATKTKTNWTAFVLEIIGSLFFLYAFATLPTYSNSGLNFGYATVFLPILVGLAAISSIALFFTSFFNLAETDEISKLALKEVEVAGFSLAALTYIQGFTGMGFVATIIGFVLALLGSIYRA